MIAGKVAEAVEALYMPFMSSKLTGRTEERGPRCSPK